MRMHTKLLRCYTPFQKQEKLTLIDLDSKMTLSMCCRQRIIQLYFERKVSYQYIITDSPTAKSPGAPCNLHIFLSGS